MRCMSTVDGRIVSDHDFPKGRDLTPFGILEESSNVGTAKIAFTMKPHEHRAWLSRMGFGSLTGSGITGESRGVVPNLPCRAITHATVSYGQGISVTPLQLLSAASALVRAVLASTALCTSGLRHVTSVTPPCTSTSADMWLSCGPVSEPVHPPDVTPIAQGAALRQYPPLPARPPHQG